MLSSDPSKNFFGNEEIRTSQSKAITEEASKNGKYKKKKSISKEID